MATITLDDLAHAYRPNPEKLSDYALKPLNHVWEDGGAYALLGPSGCGKTTLLNVISGLVTPSHGRVLFDGADITEMSTERRNIAQVFQFPVVYDTMTVRQNLAFPLKNRGMAQSEIDARVAQIGQMLDMTRDLDRKAKGLTADAKQKVSLGRGLVRSDVAAILFDEPLTVIDPHLKWELRSQLKRLHHEVASTMIYVTHDQTEALTFADKVVVMLDGAVVQLGSPQELFERPEHTFVGHFIGSPGMNVLPATVEGRIATVDGVAVPLGRGYARIAPEHKVEIGVRPEHVTIATSGAGAPVQLERVDDLGRFKVAKLRLGGKLLHAVLPEDSELPADGLRATFDPARTHVYADGRIVEGEAA